MRRIRALSQKPGRDAVEPSRAAAQQLEMPTVVKSCEPDVRVSYTP